MRAAVYHRYGPPEVVRVEELAKPEPKPGEVLIKVRASTVSTGDWRARSLEMPAGFGPFGRPVFGLFGPRKSVLGSELAGEIEAVGKDVRKFKPGDAVFAFPGFDLGAHAEYRTMSEQGRVLPMPVGLSFEQAAALCFGGTTALYYLRELAKLRAGERLLVIGASGAVGSAAIQLAKHLGAHVTGVCSTANLECARSLGADQVIDYTRQRFTESSEQYDVIFDTVGGTSLAGCEGALRERGRLLLCAADLFQLLGTLLPRGHKRVLAGNASERLADLEVLRELAEAGHYRPLIDRVYPLSAIAEAHAYVDTGRKRGSVVIDMAS